MAQTKQTMPLEAASSSKSRLSPSTLSSLLLTLSVLWCVYWFFHAWHYWEDDAYIHLEFARSVAAGQGFAFNGHVVAGDTAPLWVLLLAAVHLLIPNWLVAGKVLTILGAIFGFSGIYAFARRIGDALLPATVAAVFPAAIVLLTLVNPYTCYWIFSGMEPIAAAGLACWATLLATADRPCIRKFLAGCLLAGLGPLLRPEMAFLAVLLAAPLLGQLSRISSKPQTKALAFAAGFFFLAAPLGLWSLYSMHAFGHFLPNTNAAKRAAPGDSILKRLFSVYVLGEPLILFGTLAGAAYLALRPGRVWRSLRNAVGRIASRTQLPDGPKAPGSALPLAGWIFILWPLIASCFYIVNHTYIQTRYIYITAPGLTIILVALALKASDRVGRAVYGLALLSGLLTSLLIAWPLIRNKDIDCELTRQLALHIHDHVPANAPVAVYSIGEIAFYSQHPIIDTGGITRPGAIPYLDDPPALLRWARSEGAQYYITDKSPEPGSVLVFSTRQRALGWTLHVKSYSESGPVGLWKLPPSDMQQQAPPATP